jgi:ABC-type phosphate/phosphonate transport system substrate-binding protein
MRGQSGVMKRDMPRNVKGFLVLAFGFALLLAVLCPAQNRKSDDLVVRFAISPGTLEANANPDDVLAAARIWAATLGTSTGSWTQSDAKIYHDLSSLAAETKNGNLDIIALSTEEYLNFEGSLRAEPVLTYIQSGQVDLEYIIIAHQDSSHKTIADLRMKKVSIAKGGRNSMIPLWLDALLFDSKLPAKESFFQEIKEVAKTSQAILPVFFRQIDAGVVTQSAFDAAVALNPQIGKQVKILATSPKLVPMVTCFSTFLSPDRRKAFVEKALKLHENPKGLQSFNVFKLERLVQWEPWYFDSTRDLIKKRKLASSTRQAQSRFNSAEPEERKK